MPCHQIIRIGIANVLCVCYCSALRTFRISFGFVIYSKLLLALIPFLSPVWENPCNSPLASLSLVSSPVPFSHSLALFSHILWDWLCFLWVCDHMCDPSVRKVEAEELRV